MVPPTSYPTVLPVSWNSEYGRAEGGGRVSGVGVWRPGGCSPPIVATCFGVYHNALEGLQNFREELSAWETELEEYIPRDATLLPQIPALLLRHSQIRWSNWLAAQWGKTLEVPFPNLAGLWTAMDNQEPWEPIFPAGYNLIPDTASLRPSQGPPTPARWNPVEIPTAPPRTAPTPPTPKAKTASRGVGR